jgi:hypothetical protein
VAELLAGNLAASCPELLGPSLVSQSQLRRVILRSLCQANSVGSAQESDNLNLVSEAELAAAKARMETTFKSHALMPGDEGYIHDRRVEFQPTESNEWDSD